ncbi:MAG: hypothetical protein O3C57_06290, partial [Verrucomicrobia bacterium]|nr:hypothetical protein [Verrucomicrobiota bacterium]
RGDPRDYLRATKLYPGAKIHMSGWIPFLVWHMPFLDAPYRACRLQVMNRYDLWCRLLHIERGDLAQHFFQSDRVQIKKHKALIHVGAQWKSKQYPFVFALIEQLSALGLDVQTVRGPGDSVPNGLRAIEELKDDALVQAMRDSDLVITNDSGPLHLAALLGLPVFAISRVSNLAYWGPPGIFPICSASMPKGYAPPRAYFSDDPGSDWPSAQQVISIIRKHTRL